MRRTLAVLGTVVALSVPASFALVGTSTPAGATSPVTCSKVKGLVSSSVMTVKKCTPANAEIKATVPLPIVFGPSTSTLTWNDGNTTIVTATSTMGGILCPGGIEFTVKGHVIGGTSTYTAVGDKVKFTACIPNPLLATSSVSLAPGTVFKL